MQFKLLHVRNPSTVCCGRKECNFSQRN